MNEIKKGDRVSVIDQSGFEDWGLDDCTVLYVDAKSNLVTLKVNKGASHIVQEKLDNIKPHSNEKE